MSEYSGEINGWTEYFGIIILLRVEIIKIDHILFL